MEKDYNELTLKERQVLKKYSETKFNSIKTDIR